VTDHETALRRVGATKRLEIGLSRLSASSISTENEVATHGFRDACREADWTPVVDILDGGLGRFFFNGIHLVADKAGRLLLGETCNRGSWLTAASCCEEWCAFEGLGARLPEEGTHRSWGGKCAGGGTSPSSEKRASKRFGEGRTVAVVREGSAPTETRRCCQRSYG
jgi:hypothetical protein